MSQGSAGNVIAALASFFIPGLGQLVQGRIIAALVVFLIAVAIYVFTFTLLWWLGHIIAAIEAALWRRPV